MSKIWFTSDTHYWHKNIAGPKVSQWPRGYRNFEDEREMSQHIVKVFNQTVAEEDVLYHLGDWSFGGIQNIWNFRKQLRCQTIHLMLGNHDHHIQKDRVLPNCRRDEVDDETMTGVLDGAPEEDKWFQFEVNAREIFTSVNDTLTVKHGQTSVFMSHYAHRVWDKSHHGRIHLYGHSHASIDKEPYGKSMDVGIDNAKKLLGEYRPFSIEEINNIMKKREIHYPDHHSRDTN